MGIFEELEKRYDEIIINETKKEIEKFVECKGDERNMFEVNSGNKFRIHTIEEQLDLIINEMYSSDKKDSDPEVEDILFIRKCIKDYKEGKGVKEAIKVYFYRHWK